MTRTKQHARTAENFARRELTRLRDQTKKQIDHAVRYGYMHDEHVNRILDTFYEDLGSYLTTIADDAADRLPDAEGE